MGNKRSPLGYLIVGALGAALGAASALKLSGMTPKKKIRAKTVHKKRATKVKP